MSNIKKGKIILSIRIIILIFVTIGSVRLNFILNSFNRNAVLEGSQNYQFTQLKNSDSWILGPIEIDDNGLGDYTWEEAALESWCSGKGTWAEPYIIENVTIDTDDVCLYIKNSDGFFIIRNCTFLNAAYGIGMLNVKNGTITNNTCTNNAQGIRLAVHCSNNTISENFVNNNGHGIYTYADNPNNRFINNTLTYNSGSGIFFNGGGNSCNITNNKIIGIGDLTGDSYAGINLHTSPNVIIRDNVVVNSSDEGIHVRNNCDNNKILNNTIKGSETHGISIEDGSDSLIISNNIIKKSGNNGLQIIGGNNHSVLNNTINESGNNGIYLSGGNSHIISNNSMNYCGTNGIYLSVNDNNIISKNNCSHSNVNGLLLENSHYNNISRNQLYNNTENGIYISRGHHNQFWENDIRNSTIYSVKITTSLGIHSINNIFYHNSFINCVDHVYDWSSLDSLNRNYWNSSTIGNYWDDYTGFDENDDGIGDSPYEFYLPFMGGFCRDYLPIWDDGDDIPIINISMPLNGTFCGKNPPNYEFTIFAEDFHTSWYSLNDGKNYTLTSTSGIINQSAWEACDDGIVKIDFYINDTAGNIGNKEIELIKDSINPMIHINSPTYNQLCGIIAPSFLLTIDELNIQEKSYSFNLGDNITFTNETQFEQTEWDKVGNGTVLITFYVLDKAGNMNSSVVSVRKDAYMPEITINSPIPDDIFGNTPPEFDISIVEVDLVSTWYKIEGIATEFPISELIDSIDQDTWDNLPQGEITLTFYAQDIVGNIGTQSVVVIKRIPSQSAISGYNLFFLIGVLSVLSLIIRNIIKRK